MTNIDLLPPRITSKFRIDAETGCWRWTGSKARGGYGQLWIAAKKGWRKAHQVTYELLIGPIPDGLELDHLCHTRDRDCPGGTNCRHRCCVNPTHLEPVTHAENLRRGGGVERAAELRRAITHCPQNHPYDEVNTHRNPSGSRVCRTCKREAMRRVRARKKAS
ncbi:HNH endonuclease [Sphaerisporangium album]|uniref:HNH endonuclease n=1 Tax=Sphaerisporangium album TaxID=509200 RepID=A0A367FAD0_9ACTN|nr:HNH endonuclease [Sphaerisporangium album]RCG27221.1 HNH endonuclease [Sphaerisporangium album]